MSFPHEIVPLLIGALLLWAGQMTERIASIRRGKRYQERQKNVEPWSRG